MIKLNTLMVGEGEGEVEESHQLSHDNSGSRAGLGRGSERRKNMQICRGEAEPHLSWRRKETRQEVKYEILMEKIGSKRRRGEPPKHVKH